MSTPHEFSSYRANLQRGHLLRNQSRFAEAERYLGQAISEQPLDAEGHYEMAFCYCNWTGHSKPALQAIDRAISIDPGQARFFALRAWILGNLKKYKDAIRVGDEALVLNPHDILALNAQTRAYSAMSDWKRAEANSRRTLSLNARNAVAANLLAQALRQQGRLAESEAVTAGLLAHVPNNPMAQANAGWSALRAGDHRRANRHFLESLRLDPGCDYARQGLLHSLNSRVWIYRMYFQFVSWLGRHRRGTRYVLLGLIYVAFRLIVTGLHRAYGDQSFYWVFVAIALYIIIFGSGRSFGNLFLLLDPFARHALTAKEKRWSIFVGFFYAFIIGFEVVGQAWLQAGVLLGIAGLFLWGVLAPRLQDAVAKPSPSDEGDPGAVTERND